MQVVRSWVVAETSNLLVRDLDAIGSDNPEVPTAEDKPGQPPDVWLRAVGCARGRQLE